MDPILWLWVATGAAGTGFAALVLRESFRDRDAARHRLISQAAWLFLKETIRTTWYRLATLAAFTAAGVIPALIPAAVRPIWARQITVWLLILGEVLLTVDTGLRLRAKRRLLRQFRSERNEHSEHSEKETG